jgi:hypothetical protein
MGEKLMLNMPRQDPPQVWCMFFIRLLNKMYQFLSFACIFYRAIKTNKLFIGGVSQTTSVEDVKAYLNLFGEVIL